MAEPFALFEAWRSAMRQQDAVAERHEAVGRYAHAIPSPSAVRYIAASCPSDVVELGAGSGYWAHVLTEAGVDVVAYDLEPVEEGSNDFFGPILPWFPVLRGDETSLPDHAKRALLLVWPTRNEEWPARAVSGFHAAGGTRLVYVGEPPGGRTGDDVFHASLGEITGCVHCGYGVADAMCICGVEQLWRRSERVELPHWPGFDDDLYLYERS